MKKRYLIGIAIVLVVLLLALFGGKSWYDANHATIGGVTYPVDITALDLSGVPSPELDVLTRFPNLKELDLRGTGISIADYDALRELVPDCAVRWSVPFQGGFQDDRAESLSISTLTDADMEVLPYFPNLTAIDARDCADYGQLMALKQRFPDLSVQYNVEIQGTAYPHTTTGLELEPISPQELDGVLPYLPELTSLRVSGIQTDVEGFLALMDKYPQIAFSWDTEILGVAVNSLAEEADFSGIPVPDLAAFEADILRMPHIKKVIMSRCGIPNEEMDALNRRHEDVQFVWSIFFQGREFRTDITSLMPAKHDVWINERESRDLRYFTELICLDLGHHSICDFDFVAYMPKLQYLLLGDTNLWDLTPLTGLEDLIYLEIFLTNVTDYTPLLTLTKLEDLNLSYTKGQVDVIAQLTWVKYIRWVYMDETPIFPEQQAFLRESLPNTFVEFGIGVSSTGGQWRQTENYFTMRDILGMGYMTG